MFGKALLGAVALLAGSAVVASAGPKDDVVAAAKKLADGGNYTWKTTTETANQGGFTPGPVEGKTQKDGLTMITTSFNDQTSITVRQGDKGAVKRGDQEWMSLAEAQQAGGGRGRGFGGGGGAVAPAAQFTQNIDRLTDVQKQGDVYTSTVTGDAVSAFTQFGRGGGRGRGGAGGGAGGAAGAGGGQAPQITNGKVTLKFTVKDGNISKYEMVLQGSMNFNGNDFDMGRTTTTEIKDVGTTKVEVPAEAKAKLAQ